MTQETEIVFHWVMNLEISKDMAAGTLECSQQPSAHILEPQIGDRE